MDKLELVSLFSFYYFFTYAFRISNNSNTFNSYNDKSACHKINYHNNFQQKKALARKVKVPYYQCQEKDYCKSICN